ncbi:MAG: hypothetical protein B7Z72_13190 [Gemmatimonadetes bacterium 21-71-4]|nr:MAG: hypothetical protein B7Z72_13190 [Gemmatimonadetes bacterium 21-71-4]
MDDAEGKAGAEGALARNRSRLPVAAAASTSALAGALVAWSIARPLGSAFLRAALAMMAVMGTALVAAATLPAHLFLGRAGLALLAALCLGAIILARHVLLEPKA